MSNDPGPWSHPPPRRRRPFPDRVSSSDDWGYIARGVGALALVASSLLAMRPRLKDAARYVLIWLALGAAVVVGFTYKADLVDAATRMRAALIPAYAVAAGDHSLVLGEDAEGAYHVVGQVNGQAVGFLVDTGASDVVLSPADAERIGVDMASLRYTHAYETANGIGQGATYIAPNLTIGPIRLTNVAMSINQAPMSSSLLGMTFFKRIESFEFKGGQLTLRWRD
jgi:aspartyl protease family protein